jgi:UDP-glucose 4-epimerase
VNVTGTLNVLHAAREAGVRRVVNASSSSVYGDSPQLPKHEQMPTDPLSPYAVSKLAAERYCSVFWNVYRLETVSLRYFNVFGPRQDPTSQYSAVIPKFIVAMNRDESPVIYGDVEQSRDYTYVANVVEANLLAAQADCQPGLAMNCACHERITLKELVERINSLLHKSIKPTFASERPGDIKHSYADITLAGKKLGYKPQINFIDGLSRTVDWYLQK